MSDARTDSTQSQSRVVHAEGCSTVSSVLTRIKTLVGVVERLLRQLTLQFVEGGGGKIVSSAQRRHLQVGRSAAYVPSGATHEQATSWFDRGSGRML